MTATGPKLSRLLLEHGIDRNTSDMHYTFDGKYHNHLGKSHNDKELPSWSLDALLNLMPPQKVGMWVLTRGCWYCDEYNPNAWAVSFETNCFEYHLESGITAIFAVTKMILWLKKNKYI